MKYPELKVDLENSGF